MFPHGEDGSDLTDTVDGKPAALGFGCSVVAFVQHSSLCAFSGFFFLMERFVIMIHSKQVNE